MGGVLWRASRNPFSWSIKSLIPPRYFMIMPNKSIEEVKELLVADVDKISFQEDCLAALAHASVHIARAARIEEIRDIYAMREKWNKKNGSPIRGFDELIPSLERETSEQIDIISIRANHKGYFVFATPDRDHIVGILAFDDDPSTSPIF